MHDHESCRDERPGEARFSFIFWLMRAGRERKICSTYEWPALAIAPPPAIRVAFYFELATRRLPRVDVEASVILGLGDEAGDELRVSLGFLEQFLYETRVLRQGARLELLPQPLPL